MKRFSDSLMYSLIGLFSGGAIVSTLMEMPPVSALTPPPTGDLVSPPPPRPIHRIDLLTVEWQGGFCPLGECQATLSIRKNGRYQWRNANGRTLIGRFNSADMNRLRLHIQQANFAQLKAKPFTGICPIAYDGQKQIFTFRTPQGLQPIDSYETAIDPQDPLWQQVNRLLDQVAVELAEFYSR